MKASRWIVLLVIFVTVLASSGCGNSSGTGGKLEGIRWALGSYSVNGALKEAPGGVAIDALFENGTVNGFSGVNTYEGPYKLSGSNLSVGELTTTMMAGPRDLMTAEEAYLTALVQASSFTADSSSLVLFDKGGKKILEYNRAKAPSLTGVTWNAISYNNGRGAVVSVINGTRITAVFSLDGALTGSTGVSDYKTAYKLDGARITIAEPTATPGSATADPAAAQQAKDYLAALQLAARCSIQRDRLDLLRSDGGVAATFQLAK